MQRLEDLSTKPRILNIFCDGGARGNPGPAAVGFVVYDDQKNILNKHSKFIGNATNNVAEYQAVISALNWLKENYSNLSDIKVNFFVDSKLVASQLSGSFKIKNQNLKALVKKVRSLENAIGLVLKSGIQDNLSIFQKSVDYLYIPREKNKVADSLLNKELEKHGFPKKSLL